MRYFNFLFHIFLISKVLTKSMTVIFLHGKKTNKKTKNNQNEQLSKKIIENNGIFFLLNELSSTVYEGGRSLRGRRSRGTFFFSFQKLQLKILHIMYKTNIRWLWKVKKRFPRHLRKPGTRWQVYWVFLLSHIFQIWNYRTWQTGNANGYRQEKLQQKPVLCSQRTRKGGV